MKFSTLIAASAIAFLAPALAAPTPATEPELERRYFKGTPVCGQVAGQVAPWADVHAAAQNLQRRGSGETLTAGPGPGNCARAVCIGAASISFCNDNGRPFTASLNQLGDAALKISDTCPNAFKKGQWFNTENWNVVVNAC